MRIGHIELVDAKGEDFLFHLLDVVGLELQVHGLQKVARIQSRGLPDEAEVKIIELKAVTSSLFTLTLQPRTSQ